MCLTPVEIEPETLVACRECRLCRENRVNDYVGRCIAEQKTADATFSVTFTYAGEGAQIAVLRYEDFRNAIRAINERLRRADRKAKRPKGTSYVRFIVAGEYGSKKGRAHWHAILFFYGWSPEVIPAEKVEARDPWDVVLPRWRRDDAARINWAGWKHGYSYFQPVDYGGMAYVLKYTLKDQQSRSVSSHLSMSKRPPLGHEWFMARAEEYVAKKLHPQSFEYSFPDVKKKDGQRRKFWIQGKTRDNFLRHYFNCWRERWGEDPPLHEVIGNHVGKYGAVPDFLPEDARKLEPFDVRDKAYFKEWARAQKSPEDEQSDAQRMRAKAWLHGVGFDHFKAPFRFGTIGVVDPIYVARTSLFEGEQVYWREGERLNGWHAKKTGESNEPLPFDLDRFVPAPSGSVLERQIVREIYGEEGLQSWLREKRIPGNGLLHL
jgi:hypothetical protein